MELLAAITIVASLLFTNPNSLHTKDGKCILLPPESPEPGAEAPMTLDDGISRVVLKTANGCGIGNFIIPCTGDTSQGIPPTIGSITDSWPDHFYNMLDTVPGNLIHGVAFRRSAWPINTSVMSAINPAEPYVVISDTGMFTYIFDWDFCPSIGGMYELDSLFIPGIRKVARQITTDASNPIALLVQDTSGSQHIRAYSYPGLVEQFSFPFPIEPEVFEVAENSLYITGWDTTGAYMLYRFSALDGTLSSTYTLNDSASRAREFLKLGDSLCLLSTPGDSITVLTTIRMADSAQNQSVVYPQGARATYNEYRNYKYFTFQPTDTVLGKQILLLNPATAAWVDTLMINLQLDWFKHPEVDYGGFGYFQMGWLGARWDNGVNDSIFISDADGLNPIRLEHGAFPQHINATYGCWVGRTASETEKIRFGVHPNPATSEAVISLTGIEKGRDYTLTISDASGRVLCIATIHAYEEYSLPLGGLEAGLYYLNLDTGRNIITRKLVVQ